MSPSLPVATFLPGRSRVIFTCHLLVSSCPDCLAAIAGFLARELSFDLDSSRVRSAEWYGGQLYPERPTEEQAAELRRLVIEICEQAQAVRA